MPLEAGRGGAGEPRRPLEAGPAVRVLHQQKAAVRAAAIVGRALGRFRVYVYVSLDVRAASIVGRVEALSVVLCMSL